MLKILIIGLVWPEPTSSAAGWRMVHLVKLLLQKYDVHFASAASKSAYSYDLVGLGVKEHNILLNDSSFDVFIQDLDPYAVVFDRFMVEEQYSWRIAENVPQALRVLDTEDLHFLRLARQEAYKKNTPVHIHNETAKREIAAILRSDVSLIISNYEMQLLVDEFKVDKERLLYLPFQEELLEEPIHREGYTQREHFVFIGNFIHEPNWRTVEILKRTIWPKVRKAIPHAELHVYGAYASEKVYQLHNPKERFFIKGRAGDARETLEKYRILLAPIPFGAGAKGKFVDAMYAGTPTVTTTVGAENMSLDGYWGGYIADDDNVLVEKAIDLYNNDDQWYIAQQKGFNIFNQTIANTTYSASFLSWFEQGAAEIARMRSKNFIGQILQQQQFNATKYMSLWIEQKNAK